MKMPPFIHLCYSATANAYVIRIPYIAEQIPPLLPPHTDREMFLVICELTDKLSGSLGGNHDSVDRVIGNRLNKVIVGVNKRSRAAYKSHPKAVSRNTSSTLIQPGPKVGKK